MDSMTILLIALAVVILVIVIMFAILGNKLAKITDKTNEQFDNMRQAVDEKLDDKLSQSFTVVNESLRQVYEGLGEMKTIANQVGDVKKVLSGVKTRGILGEVQLGSILEEILSKEQYETEVATIPGSSQRVEFAVKMPGQGEGTSVWLPIDSKFPGESYAKLMEAYDSGDKFLIEETKKALERTIKSEARDIKSKYVQPPYTTDFGIMFLPFEGLYAEVVRMGMIEVLQREYKINIAGPTTMAALLNSLQMGFRTLAIERHSSEVWEILGAVKSEFASFSSVLEQTRTRLKQADSDLDALIGTRTRAIERKLKSVESLNDDLTKEIMEE